MPAMIQTTVVPRLRAWWLRRLPQLDQTALHQHNLYLLPTRAGWMLGFTLLK